MKSAGSISKMLNQKIEHINPDELGKYQIESEFSISRKVSAGDWSDEEGDAELLRIREEVKQITDAYSSSQYTWYREMYHHHAETGLGLSYLQDLIISYDMIIHLLEKCIDYRRLLISGPKADEVSSIYLEMLSEYQQRREDILSSSFWQEHHPPAAEVLS